MKLRYWLPAILLIGAGVAAWRIDKWKSQPPEINFAHVARETIVSVVPTNGKVEPVESAGAHAERPGAVQEILIQLGQPVAKGEALLRLDDSDAVAERDSAEASIAQIRADLDVISSGGRAADRARLQSDLEQAQLSLEHAREDYQKYQGMLVEKIATKAEVTAKMQKVDDLEAQVKGLKEQQNALVSPTDRSSAEARLRNAQAALHLAEAKISQSVVRAPIDGEVYQFDVKRGSYLNAGDTVAMIGRLDQVDVKVYVDERDLGRVAKAMPVRITWDALPGREWKGVVNKLPTQISALGTRQVGEVVCLIDNPKRELKPGANVNVEIRAEAAENVLTIPKEALRNENGQEGVYVLAGDAIHWRPLKLGIGNVTRTQVTSGLSENDSVALLAEKTLKDGMLVQPVFQ
ncbi:MAG TPA: efflux RND transporter periplasmic adaptor subunit [Bryobacteraceae bacterium]